MELPEKGNYWTYSKLQSIVVSYHDEQELLKSK